MPPPNSVHPPERENAEDQPGHREAFAADLRVLRLLDADDAEHDGGQPGQERHARPTRPQTKLATAAAFILLGAGYASPAGDIDCGEGDCVGNCDMGPRV